MFSVSDVSQLPLSTSQFVITTRDQQDGCQPAVVLGEIRVRIEGAHYRPLWVVDKRGRQIAFFLGTVIDEERWEVVTGTCAFPCEASGDDDTWLHTLEEFAYQFSGSWLLAVCWAGERRIYLDPCGTMGLVFDRGAEHAASSAAALLGDAEYRARFRRKLFHDLDVIHMGWFPGTITAHEGVERLLPNHYLDLTSWQVHRHWPTRSRIARNPDGVSALDALSDSITAQCTALLNSDPIAVALTAGVDSRFVLASTRALKGEIAYATVRGVWNSVDSYGARRLASLCEVPHHIVGPPVHSRSHGCTMLGITWGARILRCIRLFNPWRSTATSWVV